LGYFTTFFSISNSIRFIKRVDLIFGIKVGRAETTGIPVSARPFLPGGCDPQVLFQKY
jgi:hypothetical protein